MIKYSIYIDYTCKKLYVYSETSMRYRILKVCPFTEHNFKECLKILDKTRGEQKNVSKQKKIL